MKKAFIFLCLLAPVISGAQGLLPYRPTPWTLARDFYFIDLRDRVDEANRKLDELAATPQPSTRPVAAPVEPYFERAFSPDDQERLRLMDSIATEIHSGRMKVSSPDDRFLRLQRRP